MIYIDNNTTGFTIPRITNGIGDKVILINQITKRRFELSTDVLNDEGYKVDITDLKLEIGQYDYVVKKNNIPLESGILQVGGYKSQNNQYEVDYNIIQYEPNIVYTPLPEKVLNVTENGVYNVESFDKVDVDVEVNLSLIEELEQELEAKLEEINNLQIEVEEKTSQIQTLQTENTNLQQQIEEKEGNISELEAQIEENNSLIASLQQDIDNLNQQIVDLTASILEKDDEITSLNNQINSVTTISITENGTYTPEEGILGWNAVEVNVEGGGGPIVPPLVETDEYFYIQAIDNDTTLCFTRPTDIEQRGGTNYYIRANRSKLEYSYNNLDNWTAMTDLVTFNLNQNERLYIRCINGSWQVSAGTSPNSGLFGSTKEVNVGGDASKLLNSYYLSSTTPTINYANLFRIYGSLLNPGDNVFYIKNINIKTPYAGTNMSYIVAGTSKTTESLTSFNISDASNVTNASYMCAYNNTLSNFGVKNLNKVTNASDMFNGCSSLKTINATSSTGFNMSNVTNTTSMFNGCTSLTTAYVNFSKTTSTDYLPTFGSCTSLQDLYFEGSINYNLDLTACSLLTPESVISILTAASKTTRSTVAKELKFNLSVIKDDTMTNLISLCTSKGWTISGLNLIEIVDYSGQNGFYLQSLADNNVISFNKNVLDGGLDLTFKEISTNTGDLYDIGNIEIQNTNLQVSLKYNQFLNLKGCYVDYWQKDEAGSVSTPAVLTSSKPCIMGGKIKYLLLYNIISPDNYVNLFHNFDNLYYCTTIDCEKMKSTDYWFANCNNLRSVDKIINTDNVTNFRYMFYNCDHLKTIGQIDVSSGADFNNMFMNCYNLENVEFEGSINSTINFNSCDLLTYESVKSILTACSNTTNTNSKTVIFNRTLTDQNGELATLIVTCNTKGWTVSGLTLE